MSLVPRSEAIPTSRQLLQNTLLQACVRRCRPSVAPCQLTSSRAPLVVYAQESSASSSGAPAEAAPKPLSPRSSLPSNSGISVDGYSPTSLQGWAIVKQTLRDANVKMVSAQEVVFAQERGVPVIDVRPAESYAEVRAKKPLQDCYTPAQLAALHFSCFHTQHVTY